MPRRVAAAIGFLGVSTANVDANDVAWDFFVKHPLPAAHGGTSH